MNNESSTNRKKLISTSFFPIFTPLKRFNFFACHTNLVIPSTTKRRKKGAIGSPCLNPLDGLNFVVALLLTSTNTDDDSRHSFTHPIHLSSNPSLVII